MIKIYSSQEKPDVISMVDEIPTNETEWWMIYDAINNNVIIPPQQCAGGTSSPFTMVIADTEDELNEYIINNNLTLPVKEFNTIYNIR
jgi:hypothetical protein